MSTVTLVDVETEDVKIDVINAQIIPSIVTLVGVEIESAEINVTSVITMEALEFSVREVLKTALK